MPWRVRRRRRGRGRPCIEPIVYSLPEFREFTPKPLKKNEPLVLTYPEYEALRLVDYEGLTCEESARRMGISRGSFWRLLASARKKLVTSLIESRPLTVQKEELEEVR
jgi:predicted DNA-binding protein (UPF0251 family)